MHLMFSLVRFVVLLYNVTNKRSNICRLKIYQQYTQVVNNLLFIIMNNNSQNTKITVP